MSLLQKEPWKIKKKGRVSPQHSESDGTCAMSAAYEHGFAEGLVDETERRGVF